MTCSKNVNAMTVQGEALKRFIKAPTRKYNSAVLVIQKNKSSPDETPKTRAIIDFTKLNSVNARGNSSRSII